MSDSLSIVLTSGLAIRAYVQARDSFLQVPITFVLTENSEPGLYEVQLSGLTTGTVYYASIVDAGSREVVGYTNPFLWDGTNAIDLVQSFSQIEQTQLDELHNTLVSDGVFSTAALANIPSAIGMASANLDTQLADLPTTAEFEARTLPTADYFDASTDAVTLATDAVSADALAADAIAEINATVDQALTDYGANTTTPPTASAIASQVRTELTTELGRIDAAISTRQATVTFPSNFSLLSIDGSGQVTSENMRGTDGANTTAPDNATIASIASNVSDIIADIADMQGTGFVSADHSLKAIRDRGDDAWVTATGFNTTTPPTAAAIRTEIDTNSTKLAHILTDTGTTLPAQISGLNDLAIADVETALSNYDAPVYATLQTYGDANWATATGFSTFDGDLSGIPAAVWGYSGRTLDGSQATAIALISTINTNVASCLSAATAVTDGRFVNNYTLSTATQYDTDGSVRTVFDLLDANGDPATSAQNAVERRPQ